MAEEAPTTEQPAKSNSLLASKLFGTEFKGEVVEPEAPPEEEGEEPPEEPEVEAQEEVEEGEEVESTEEEEQPISSLDELIEHYEWDPEWVNTINVPIKVDGQTSAVPLKDLVSSHQMNLAADKRLEEAKAKAQTQTQEFEQKSEELKQKFIEAGTLIEKAEELLDRDSKSINWKQLREDDPAEYSAKKAEIAERKQEIERMKQEAIDKYQKSVADQSQGNEQAIKELQQQELNKLVQDLEIKTQDDYQEWSNNTAKYLMGSGGFEESELQNILDHRFYILAHKARLYDEGQKKTEAAKKKVAKVPKTLKPGAAKSKQQVDKDKASKFKTQLRKSGSVDDAFAYLKATRGG